MRAIVFTLSASVLCGAALAQQANVNLDYNPQKNTENLVPFSAPLNSPDVRDDRTVTFRLKAPSAQRVELAGVAVLTALGQEKPVPFQKGADGVWSLSVGPLRPDMYVYHLVVDGVQVADPNNTVAGFTAMPPYSQLVVHGEGPAYYDARDVPHGAVTRHVYRSGVTGGERELYVYTPPGYDRAKTYPVLYLVGGSGDLPHNWIYDGRVSFMMDNLLAEGKAVPMVIAIPNNQVVHRSHPRHVELTFAAFERELRQHVIPLVEKQYSVRSDPRGRALSGLSMGGRHTMFVGFRSLDLFASFGVLSAGDVDSETSLAAFLNSPDVNAKVRYLFVGQGTEEAKGRMGQRCVALHEALLKHGVRHEYYVGGHGGHDWATWRHLVFYKFLPGLWRDDAQPATTRPMEEPHTRVKVPAVPGEQAPPADPGQNNFGAPITRPGPGGQRPPGPPRRPEPKFGTVSLDQISMSDPFVFPDEKTRTYYLIGSGGRLYKSPDLKLWTGPYSVIDLSGTWMDGHFVAAPEIHHIGARYYLAGTWNDHGHPIENVPRRYNVPTNQTQLLVADSPVGPYKPLVPEFDFCLGPGDWDIIDGTLYQESGTTYMVFVHEWTQIIDGTIASMPLSTDLTRRTAEPTTLFRASEAAWAKEMNSIGEATFGLKMPGWVTDGPQLFRTQTGRLGMLWSSWGDRRYVQGVAYSTSGSVKGPWVQEKEPLMGDNSGHGMLFRTFDGTLLFIVHHAEGKGPRKPQIWKADDSGDELRLLERYGS